MLCIFKLFKFSSKNLSETAVCERKVSAPSHSLKWNPGWIFLQKHNNIGERMHLLLFAHTETDIHTAHRYKHTHTTYTDTQMFLHTVYYTHTWMYTAYYTQTQNTHTHMHTHTTLHIPICLFFKAYALSTRRKASIPSGFW